MGALRLAGLLMLGAVGQAAASQTTAPIGPDHLSRWQPFIAAASYRFGIPETWIRRVIAAESAGRTELDGKPIRSKAGAIGLMQLMPATWAAMRTAHGLGSNPDDPQDNIMAGTAYLRLMHDRFGYPGLFAAYNAGPGRYQAYLRGRSALPGETRAYLTTVAEPTKTTPKVPDAPLPAMLFALRHDRAEAPEQPAEASDLFAVRKPIP